VSYAVTVSPSPPVGSEIDVCCEEEVDPVTASNSGEGGETLDDNEVHDFLRDALGDFDPNDADILDVCA